MNSLEPISNQHSSFKMKNKNLLKQLVYSCVYSFFYNLKMELFIDICGDKIGQ